MNEIIKKTPNPLTPTTFEEAMKFAKMIAFSSFVPTNMKGKPEDILIAMQMGYEIGLPPMRSIQSIAVINGKPSLYGDPLLALVQKHGAFEWIKEEDSGDCATCTVKRKGAEPHTVTFSNEDAKTAKLLGKAGPWTQYPKRMRQMRARGFALRDQFADALMGFSLAEESQDIEVIPTAVKRDPIHVEKDPKFLDIKPEDRVQPRSRPAQDIEAVVIDEPASEEELFFDENSNLNKAAAFRNSLDACESLEEMKEIWISIPSEIKKELKELKDIVKLRIVQSTKG